MYASVALPIALPPLTYRVPDDLIPQLSVGSPVTVPLRKKQVSGYISLLTNEAPEVDPAVLKDISGLSAEFPVLSPSYLAFLQWISDYYHYPLGEVIQSALPPKVKGKQTSRYRLSRAAENLGEEEMTEFRKRGGKRAQVLEFLRENSEVEVFPSEWKSAVTWLRKNELIEEVVARKKPEFFEMSSFPVGAPISGLSEEQASVFGEIGEVIGKGQFKPYLLHGVTGSGKTEVYLACAQKALATGKSVLFMVPEISLTPQLFARVRQRLGRAVAILHSGLTDSQRAEQWELIHSGEARVALGARSTIFAPLRNLGLIVVDEEHESAFKQEDRLKYNARDMALLRARQEKAVVILGSATPSLETYFQSQSGKIKRLELRSRPGGGAMPRMEVVDMRREAAGTILSGRLKLQLRNTLERGKQSVLFLNRRGFSSFLMCLSCGEVPECPNCSVSLTVYRGPQTLRCHYCAYEIRLEESCKACGSKELDFGSYGTESLEMKLKEEFPEARILRIDRETTQKRGELEARLRLIAEQKVDVIVGTQMIAKGHDFPNIELAAIVNADVSLNVPDFRAFERSYQLFTQVAGRAGRSTRDGLVVLQTYEPENPAVLAARDGSYLDFCHSELERRETFHYPPYFRLVRIVVSAAQDPLAKRVATSVTQLLRSCAGPSSDIVGPAPAVLQKLLNRYRWNLLIKDKSASSLNALLRTVQGQIRQMQDNGVHITIDVDPVSLL